MGDHTDGVQKVKPKCTQISTVTINPAEQAEAEHKVSFGIIKPFAEPAADSLFGISWGTKYIKMCKKSENYRFWYCKRDVS